MNLLFVYYFVVIFGFVLLIMKKKEHNSKQTLEQRLKDQNYGKDYLKGESNSLMNKNMSQYETNKKRSKANKF